MPINVKSYGAVGNGSANDTTAIANACAAAKAATTALYFPAGTYLTDTITCINVSGMLVYGDGPLNSVIKSRTGTGVIETTGASISALTIRDLGINGNGGVSNHGIYIHNDTFTNNLTIHDVTVVGVGGRCVYLPDAFSTLIDEVGCTSSADNGIEINGWPASTIANSYVHAVGSGKSAYVIYQGSATISNCNGLDGSGSNVNWAALGQSTSLGDSANTYSYVTISGSNVEAFENYGIWVKNGTVSLYGVQIAAGASGTAQAIRFPGQFGVLAPVIDSNSNITTDGASWANGYAIHSSSSCPAIIVYNPNSATTQNCYAENVSLAYPTGQLGGYGTAYGIYAPGYNHFATPDAYFGHVTGQGGSPTVHSGFGTNPSINGFDSAGQVVIGTGGTATTGIIYWSSAYSRSYVNCYVRDRTTTSLNTGLTWAETTSQLTITATSAFGVGDVVAWTCEGY
jgi:hypothetical protein